MRSEDNFDALTHPDWVYQELVENYLPWQQGKKMSFQEFDRKYTLHDSYWLGIFFDVAYEKAATLAIQWDAVWLSDAVKERTSVVADWPYLFIS